MREIWHSGRIGNFPVIFVLELFCYAALAEAWPEWTVPVNYCKRSSTDNNCKTQLNLYMNRMNSEESLLPYEYNHFDFCPADVDSSPVENLGQEISGDRIRPGPFSINFLEDVKCAVICSKNYFDGDEDSERKLNNLRKGIRLDYQHNWILDNIPVMRCNEFADENEDHCVEGFPIGALFTLTDWRGTTESLYIDNHFDLEIIYHDGEGEDWGNDLGSHSGRILAVRVKTKGIKNQNSIKPNCAPWDLLEIPTRPLKPEERLKIVYTYSVQFVKNTSIKWSSRWDRLLNWTVLQQSSVKWNSIYLLLGSVLVLSGMIAKIWINITRYNSLEKVSEEDIKERFPWTLVKDNVFRSPSNPQLLSALVGGGVQFLMSTVFTLIFACMGFSSLEYRGVILLIVLVSFSLLGAAAGYVSARLYKRLGGLHWLQNAWLTSMLCPGVIFCIYMAMDVIYRVSHSSGAVPISSLMTLLALWLLVSLPLTFLGAYFGFYSRGSEPPAAQETSTQTRITCNIFGFLISGILLFACVYTQLFFIQNALWTTQYYQKFGVLFLTFILLTVVCAGLNILLCFLDVRAQNYHWWWNSFITSGFSSICMLLDCWFYYVTKLSINDTSSTLLYFGYTFIMIFLFFLLTGTIGFIACFWFLRKIYSNLDEKTNLKWGNLSLVINFPEKKPEKFDAEDDCRA